MSNPQSNVARLNTPAAEPSGDELREIVRDLLEEPGVTQTGLARQAGYNPSTLSQWLADKHPSDTTQFETNLRQAIQVVRESRATMPALKPVHTNAFAEIQGALALARETQGLAVIAGHPGVGKTFAAAAYAKGVRSACLLMADATWFSTLGTLESILDGLGHSWRRGNLNVVMAQLRAELQARPRFLLINDAHNLSYKAIDLLCSLAEVCQIPIALLGHELLFEEIGSLQRRDSELWDRIADRIEFTHVKPDYTREQVADVARQIMPDAAGDDEAIELLMDRALFKSMRSIVRSLIIARKAQLAHKSAKASDLLRAAAQRRQAPSISTSRHGGRGISRH